MFNRFIELRFLDAGVTLGGRRELKGTRLLTPPTIKFNCSHTSESQPNEASVEIINLSPEVQQQILVERQRVEIECGYWPQGMGRTTATVFSGTIRKGISNVAASGINASTKIELGDGDSGYARSRISKIFDGDRSHQAIVDEAATQFEKFGIIRGEIRIPAFTERRPRTVQRATRRELDDLAYQHDLQWSIQDGVFNMWPRDEPLIDGGIVLSPDNGLLSSPQFGDKGVSFRTLMIPELRPGMVVNLRNDKGGTRVAEDVKIESITFSGSNYDGQFGCQVESKYLTGDKVVRAQERYIGFQT